MLNISASPARIDFLQPVVKDDVRSHPAAAARAPHQAIQDFLGEVVSALVEPLSSAFTETLFSAGEDDDEDDNTEGSLLKELGRSSWGKVLLQSGQFQSMTRSIETSLERLEEAQKRNLTDQQRVIRGA